MQTRNPQVKLGQQHTYQSCQDQHVLGKLCDQDWHSAYVYTAQCLTIQSHHMLN